MIAGETVAAARRVGPLLALDDNDNPVTGENFNGAGELEISFDGETWEVPAGTIGEIGDGYYYYQATEAEAVAPWIAVKITGVCQEFTMREDVAEFSTGIAVDEADPELRRIGPLLALDANNDEVLGEDFTDLGELEISINGSAWAAGDGTVEEIGDGYYYYIAHEDEVAARGWIAVKLAIVVEEFTFREDIVDPPAEDLATIAVVSPTPNTPAGDPGGFSSDLATAQQTPIVLDIDSPSGVGFANVTCSFPGDARVFTVYVTGDGFVGDFAARSTAQIIGTKLRLNVLPSAGWPESGSLYDVTFDVDAIGGDGSNVTTTRP